MKFATRKNFLLTKKEPSQFQEPKILENAKKAQLDLQHSNSNGKLPYLSNLKLKRLQHSKNNKTKSSTSSVTQGSYLIRTKPSPKVGLHLEMLPSENKQLNNTESKVGLRQKPICTDLSYK